MVNINAFFSNSSLYSKKFYPRLGPTLGTGPYRCWPEYPSIAEKFLLKCCNTEMSYPGVVLWACCLTEQWAVAKNQ